VELHKHLGEPAGSPSFSSKKAVRKKEVLEEIAFSVRTGAITVH